MRSKEEQEAIDKFNEDYERGITPITDEQILWITLKVMFWGTVVVVGLWKIPDLVAWWFKG
jgi:hypothetical protein